MPIYALGGLEPSIDPTAYVHPDAVIIGAVHLAAEASVWPGAVLRGDVAPIHVAERTSIQDGAVIHTISASPTTVGHDSVVGHLVHLEGCTIEDHVLVGSGATVLPHAVCRAGSVVGAGAVVTNGMEVPPGALAVGVPAVLRRGRADPALAAASVLHYRQHAKDHRAGLRRIG